MRVLPIRRGEPGLTLCEIFMAELKHGGRRKGAGRKATGRRPYLVRMKPGTMRALKRTARPKTVGEYLDATYAPNE